MIRSPLVGIDNFNLHLTAIEIPDDAHARRIRPRYGSRHTPDPEIVALDPHAVRQGDLDLAHDRGHLDLGRSRKESRVSEIEADLAQDRPDPESLGQLP